MSHTDALVWMVVGYNHFCYFRLGHYRISAQCRMHIWGKSEAFSIYIISGWVLTFSCTLGPALFVGFSITLFFFIPLIMFFGWIIYVHSIKFPFSLILGAPLPILAISGNIILWFLDSPSFNIVNSLKITLVGVPFFIVGSGMVYVTSSSLDFCNERSFIFLLIRHKSC